MTKFILSGFSDEIHENFEIQLQSIKQLGIKYIEIRGVDSRSISTLNREEVLKIKEKLDQNNIKVSAIGSPIGKIYINDDFNQHYELFKKIVETAKILDTNYIRLFSFFIPKGENPDVYQEEVIRRLRLFVKYAEEHDVVLLHENEKDIYGDLPNRCLHLVKSINHPNFKLIFDFANFIQCGANTLEAYELLSDYIVYFHIKDALLDGTVVPAGKGNGHILDILKQASLKGYTGFTSLEPHLGAFKGLQDLELDLILEEIDDNGFERFKLAHQEFNKILFELKK